MVIASLTPDIRHIKIIAKHPQIDQFRFNTFLPVKENKEKFIRALKKICGKKRLWIDLKTRQLRAVDVDMKINPKVRLSHSISVELPVKIYYGDSEALAVNIERDNTLVLERIPNVAIEPGDLINIAAPSLSIKGYLTDNDREYIDAARKHDIHSYMLSFVQNEDDIRELISEDPNAIIIAKIESKQGLDFVKKSFPVTFQRIHLMAARNDLFIQMEGNKTEILTALRIIIKKDPEAIAASGIFSSLEMKHHISMNDLSDLLLLKILGYRNYLLGEKLCGRKESFQRAMQLWEDFTAQIKKHDVTVSESF
ncbi:MAG: hypothetical protein JW881_11195 [Spirochaetales bacterium]|nr:hypothetical protein [Spirochaetales bacterium]